MVRLSTVDFTVVSLCLKESMALPTRGRFVCRVDSLVHDGAVRLSPCGPHHESDETSIICLFRLILQANTLFYFVLWYSSSFEFICSFHISFKWLLNLWKCDDLLRNSFVHLRSNVYCEDYMLQFLSIDSTYLFVYQDANGCHPLQDGSANASESGSQ